MYTYLDGDQYELKNLSGTNEPDQVTISQQCNLFKNHDLVLGFRLFVTSGRFVGVDVRHYCVFKAIHPVEKTFEMSRICYDSVFIDNGSDYVHFNNLDGNKIIVHINLKPLTNAASKKIESDELFKDGLLIIPESLPSVVALAYDIYENSTSLYGLQ